MSHRLKDFIGGIILLVISAGLYFYNWHLITSRSEYYPKAMLFAAMMLIVGLGLMIFGGYRTERLRKGEDLDHLSGLQLLTPKWWVILIAAILFGLSNWVYIEFFY